MLLPRWAYLTMCTDKVRRHFNKPATSTPEEEPWYEYRDRPLKWNVPVGVLWDLYGGGDVAAAADSGALPWTITVHFSAFPAQELVACPTLASVEAHHLNRVKESCQIKHGSTQHEGLQSTEIKRQLWLGLLNDNYDQFTKANAPLMEAAGSGSWYKGFPFCLHSAAVGTGSLTTSAASSSSSSSSSSASSSSSSSTAPAIWTEQEPYQVVSEDGRPLTLGDLRAFMLGEEESSPASGDSPATATAETEAEAMGPKWSGEAAAGNTIRLLVHGTVPPPETPLQWLAQHYAYPDGFVHIVMK